MDHADRDKAPPLWVAGAFVKNQGEQETPGEASPILPPAMVGQQLMSGNTSKSAEFSAPKMSSDEVTQGSVELTLPMGAVKERNTEDFDLDLTVQQCFVAVLILWLLAGVLSVARQPPTEIKWPDRSNFDRRSNIIKLPPVPKSKLPRSASKLWGTVYTRSINLSVDPCDDFYRYVCDGYLHSFSRFAGDGASNVIDFFSRTEIALKSIFLERLRQIRISVHDETKTEELLESEYEVFKYFESCVNADSHDQTAYSRELFRKMLKRDDSHPNTVVKSFPIGKLKGYDVVWQVKGRGYAEIVEITPHFNKHEAHLMVGIGGWFPVGQAKRIVSARNFTQQVVTRWKRKYRERFEEVQATVRGNRSISPPPILAGTNSWEYVRSLGLREFNETTKWRIIENYWLVSNFMETELGDLLVGVSGLVHHWTLGELSKFSEDFVKTLRADEDYNEMHDDLTVRMYTLALVGLLSLFEDEKVRPAFEDHNLVVLLSEFHSYLGGGGHSARCGGEVCQKPSEESCMLLTREALPYSYLSVVQRLLTTDYTEVRMRSIIAFLKLTYAKVIKRQTWIGSETKLDLIKKVSAMVDHIGSPVELAKFEPTELATVFTSNYIENTMRAHNSEISAGLSDLRRPPVRDRRYWPSWRMMQREGDDTSPNAFHTTFLNELMVPSTLFAFPFHDETLDEGLIFATYGQILAHEIGHGLDSEGSLFGPTGLPENPWTWETYEAFKERTACLESEFDIRSPFDAEKVFKGSNFIVELASDHYGLQVIHETWRELTSGKGIKLPEGPCLTPEQQFFVSAAFICCDALDSKDFRSLFDQEDLSHPMNVIRVNRGFAHTRAFLEAFKCTSKNKMYRAKQCRVFE